MEDKIIKVSSELKYISDYKKLEEQIVALLDASKIAAQNAYAPYSKFNVGAAVLLSDGKIIKGNNQENACYPNGLCAERVALFGASANNPNMIVKALAVTIDYTKTDNLSEPVFPCGGCRQSILEYEDKQNQVFPIYLLGAKNDVIIVTSIKDILPFTFSQSVLNDYNKPLD